LPRGTYVSAHRLADDERGVVALAVSGEMVDPVRAEAKTAEAATIVRVDRILLDIASFLSL